MRALAIVENEGKVTKCQLSSCSVNTSLLSIFVNFVIYIYLSEQDLQGDTVLFWDIRVFVLFVNHEIVLCLIARYKITKLNISLTFVIGFPHGGKFFKKFLSVVKI